MKKELMTSPIKNHWFCGALLLASLQLGVADDQSAPPYTFHFGPPAIPVWDMSGLYQITNHLQSAHVKPTDIAFPNLFVGVNSKGRIEGSGTILVYVGNDIVGGDYKISGHMSGGGATTRANFSIHFKGNGSVAGVPTTCKISPHYNLQVGQVSRTLVGKATGSASFSHLGSGNLKSDIILPLPAGVDGGWTVTMDLIPFGNKLSGTATISVDNTPPAILAARLTGKTGNSGVAKVKLSGTGMSAGTHLNLDFTPISGATDLPASVNGKVLGQKVKN